MSQHPHNRIGNIIGEAKKDLFQRLKSGADIDAAIAQFIRELRVNLEIVSLEATVRENLNTEDAT